MVLTTRPIKASTPDSRSLLPVLPQKYLLATMFVARTDQSLGTRTFSCSKRMSPLAPVMRAVGSSHSIAWKGSAIPAAKYDLTSICLLTFILSWRLGVSGPSWYQAYPLDLLVGSKL